jgi:exodeoxyribonuclease VII small subunit
MIFPSIRSQGKGRIARNGENAPLSPHTGLLPHQSRVNWYNSLKLIDTYTPMTAKHNKPGQEATSYEATLAMLESIIDEVEKDGISLDKALIAFEEGVKLTREAQESLRVAEQKVTQLLDGSKGIESTNLPPNGPKE